MPRVSGVSGSRQTRISSPSRKVSIRSVPENTVTPSIDFSLRLQPRVSKPKLLSIGFDTRGWSRSEKSIDGVTVFSGTDRIDTFLEGLEILVCLLPLTPETRGI